MDASNNLKETETQWCNKSWLNLPSPAGTDEEVRLPHSHFYSAANEPENAINCSPKMGVSDNLPVAGGFIPKLLITRDDDDKTSSFSENPACSAGEAFEDPNASTESQSDDGTDLTKKKADASAVNCPPLLDEFAEIRDLVQLCLRDCARERQHRVAHGVEEDTPALDNSLETQEKASHIQKLEELLGRLDLVLEEACFVLQLL